MVGTTQTFSVSGGVAPYSFSVVGAGSVTSDGVFTAPGTTGVTVVRVTDAIQSSADASVIVSPTLAMVPAAKTLAVGNTFTFSADGGVPGYAYALVAPARGTLVGATYTAPSSAGSDTLRVTDARGHTSDATITVNAALTLGPSSVTLAVGDSKAFTAAGGVPPYTFTVPAGGGAFTVPSVGTYTTPTSAGSATVRVTDSFGNSAEAAVTINAALAISPSTVSVGAGTTQTFTATGGVGAYTFTVASGLGSVTSPGGVYTAPGSASPAVVRVSDAAGHSADAAVTVVNLSTYLGSLVEPNLVAYNGCCSNWQPAWKFNITTNGAAHTVSIDGTFTALHSNGIPPSGTWGYTVSRPGAADENVNKTISGFPVAEHLTKSYTLAAGTWVVNFSQFLRITFTVAANGTVTCNGTDGVTSYVDTSSGNQNRVPFLTISNTVQ
ncbi:MAG: hypothetical protein U1F43_36420 [Myxococcota bacterium]